MAGYVNGGSGSGLGLVSAYHERVQASWLSLAVRGSGAINTVDSFVESGIMDSVIAVDFSNAIQNTNGMPRYAEVVSRNIATNIAHWRSGDNPNGCRWLTLPFFAMSFFQSATHTDVSSGFGICNDSTQAGFTGDPTGDRDDHVGINFHHGAYALNETEYYVTTQGRSETVPTRTSTGIAIADRAGKLNGVVVEYTSATECLVELWDIAGDPADHSMLFQSVLGVGAGGAPSTTTNFNNIWWTYVALLSQGAEYGYAGPAAAWIGARRQGP